MPIREATREEIRLALGNGIVMPRRRQASSSPKQYQEPIMTPEQEAYTRQLIERQFGASPDLMVE